MLLYIDDLKLVLMLEKVYYFAWKCELKGGRLLK